jgi:hypothetical protein
VGEIGVHHGKFFIPIAGNALQAEPAIAMDLFDNQGANVDASGVGCVVLVMWVTKVRPHSFSGDAIFLVGCRHRCTGWRHYVLFP